MSFKKCLCHPIELKDHLLLASGFALWPISGLCHDNGHLTDDISRGPIYAYHIEGNGHVLEQI